MKKKKWIGNLITILLASIFFYYGDWLQSLAYFDELFFVVTIVLFISSAKQWIAQNKLIQSGKQIKLRNSMDTGEMWLSILFGALFIIASLTQFNESYILAAINYALLGIFFITLGYINRKSIVLDASNEFEINTIDHDFKIQTTDKSITLSPFTIEIEQANNDCIKLSNLDLKQSEIKELGDWVKQQLPHSDIHFNFLNGKKIVKEL